MKKKANLSIKDIASLAGVSTATVSRVLNDNGRFSEKTREKVMTIVKENGYVTNMAAKSLRVSKSKSIGLIVPNINNEWFSAIALEVENYFFKRDYSVFICNTSQDEEKEIAYFKSLDSKMVDGIISISGREEIPTDFINRDIPIVCIDRKPADHSGVYYVESNHYSGGYLATEELIKNGCKRIAIVSRKNSLSVNNQRMLGYLQALKDYNLEIDPDLQILLNTTSNNYESSIAATEKMIDDGLQFDGVFATNDWRAYGVIMGLANKNISVPEQVKIVGFDDNSIANMLTPKLSSIRQNTKGIAQTASDILMNLMQKTEVQIENKRVIFPVEVIQRESSKNS